MPYFYLKGCGTKLTISSCLASTEYNTGGHACEAAFDGNEGDGWATRNEGAGAWIRINFDGFYRLTKIMIMQRAGNERFKDISLDFFVGTSVQYTLQDSKVWEEIVLSDDNMTTNYVEISAINVHNKINNGFAELKVFGCTSGMVTHFQGVDGYEQYRLL